MKVLKVVSSSVTNVPKGPTATKDGTRHSKRRTLACADSYVAVLGQWVSVCVCVWGGGEGYVSCYIHKSPM